MKQKKRKRFLPALLTAALVMSLFSTVAFATDTEETATEAAACTVTEDCVLENGHDGDCVTEAGDEELSETNGNEELSAAAEGEAEEAASAQEQAKENAANESTENQAEEMTVSGQVEEVQETTETEVTSASDASKSTAVQSAAGEAEESSTPTVVAATEDVAKIGDTTYGTLAEAIAAAQEGDTVTLLKDTSGGGIIIGKIDGQKNFTIDFNGCTYTVNSSPLAGSPGTETQCFQLLKDTGSLTIKNGTIVADYSGVKMMIQNYCSLTLEDMTLDATTGTNNVGYVLSNNNGDTTITGSTTITAKSTGVAFDVYYWPSGNYIDGVSVTINSANVTINGTIEYGSDGSDTGKTNVAEKATLTISAGTVNGSIVTNNLDSDGEATIIISETATVSGYEGTVASMTTDNGATVHYYTTLQAAINAAGTTGATVTLLSDVTEDIEIADDQTITFDLNGYTITNANGHTITNYGILTITDSSANGTGTVDNVTHSKGALVNYGTAYLNGGTFTRSAEAGTSSSDNGGNSWYTVKNYNQMTVDGAAIENSGEYSSCFANGYQNSTDQANAEKITRSVTPTLTIISGTVTGGLNSVKNDDYAVLTIDGGTFTSYSQCALQNHSTVTINGGTFTGGTYVLYNCGCDGTADVGVMKINGGTFTADSDTKYVLMMVSSADTASVTITGGTFDATGGADASVFGATSTATEISYSTIKVSGGSFSEIVPEAYCESGYKPVTTADANGFYTVCSHSTVTHFAAKDATCTEDGNIEYWYCADCGRYFSDASLTTGITYADTVIEAAGHTYGAPVFTWSNNGKTCTATFTCSVCGDQQTVAATVTSAVKTAATATEKGVTTYTATVTFEGKTYTSTCELEDIAATGDSDEEDETSDTTAASTSTGTDSTGSAASSSSTSSAAKTGDTSNAGLWIVLLVVALGIVCGAGYGVKRKNSR